MKLKQFSNEEFTSFIKYVKSIISFADNVIITLCKQNKNIIFLQWTYRTENTK